MKHSKSKPSRKPMTLEEYYEMLERMLKNETPPSKKL